MTLLCELSLLTFRYIYVGWVMYSPFLLLKAIDHALTKKMLWSCVSNSDCIVVCNLSDPMSREPVTALF